MDLRLWLGKHDGGADFKIALLPARDLVRGNCNLCARLHAVLCFTSPGIPTPSHGALRRHPNTLQTAVTTENGVEDAGRERGLCV